MDEKEIRCNCGKMLAKIHKDGTIWVWCKSCRREVPLENLRSVVLIEKEKISGGEAWRVVPRASLTEEEHKAILSQLVRVE